MLDDADVQYFARLQAEDPEFARLAETYRELDRQIALYDRIYYLTSEQERKRNALQKQQWLVREQLSAIMRRHAREAVLHPSP